MAGELRVPFCTRPSQIFANAATAALLIFLSACAASGGGGGAPASPGGAGETQSPENGSAVIPVVQPTPENELSTAPGQEQAALPLVRADELVGKKDSEITELLGKPSLVRRDRQARIWQYRGATCVLDLFLYPPADKKNSDAEQEGARAVVYFETRSKNAEAVSNDRCISEVVSARAGAG